MNQLITVRYKILLPHRHNLIIVFVLIFLTLAIYWRVCHYEFINLDDVYITENPYFTQGLTFEGVKRAFTTVQAGYWLPLTWLSHTLDFELYGADAGWHHLTNLLFHISNVLILFITLKSATGATWQSAFTAALFAIHPLHVESVTWVAERKDVLSAFFGFLTIRAYFYYVKNPNITRYLVTIFLYASGLMSKPMLVTLPFVLILLDYWPLMRFQMNNDDSSLLKIRFNPTQSNPSSKFPPIFLEKIPFILLAIITSFITIFAQQSAGAVNSFDALPLTVRIENALISYVAYIGKMLFPIHLAVLYPHPMAFPVWKVGVSLGLLIGITILIFRFSARHPYLLVGWLWHLITLAPVIGIMQSGVQSMADRFAYIPLIGIYVIISWGAADILYKFRYLRIFLIVAATAVLSTYIFVAKGQVRHWQNSITLYEHTLSVTTDNYVIHNHLGAAFKARNEFDKAITHFKQAIRINPLHASALSNLGAAWAEKGNTSKAIDYYNKALEIDPNRFSTHYNLALGLMAQGRVNEAVKHYRKVLRLNPRHAEAHNNYGVILANQGHIDDAEFHFSEALRLKPDYCQAHYNMGLILYRKGEKRRAMIHFQKSKQIHEPDS